MSPGRNVGRSTRRLESESKVDGTVEYIHHISRPGMLHGQIVRSTEANARLTGIDVSAALAAPGVVDVITAAEVKALMPSPFHGPAFWDQPVLADDRVRYWGEPIAVVLATDPHLAADGAAAVAATYEPMAPVFDEREAATDGAPLVHDRLQPAGTFPDLKHLEATEGTNVAMDAKVRRGDAAAAFAAADVVMEHTFRTQPCAHTTLEPPVALAEPDSGGVLVHTASQNPSYVRMELARLLGWPENRVRVRTAFVGGGFGAKLYLKLEALVVVAALRHRRPVKISLTMDETFLTITRHGSTARIKTGARRDGTIVAREVELWWNNGAYADVGPRVAHKAALVAAGPYDIEHLTIDSLDVYTNLPPAGALRGFGIPQVVFAYECQHDMLAAELGVDPIELREKNLLRNGRPQATGTTLEHTALPEVLATLRQRLRWDEPFDRGDPSSTVRRGRGIAIALKACLAPTTSVATVSMYGDGSIAVATSTVDMGQGSDTVLAQLAGEVLEVPTVEVRMVHPDTDVTPYDMGTIGSRSTFHTGNAVVAAAESVRAQLLDRLASAWECPVEGLCLRDGQVAADGRSVPYADAMRQIFGMEAGTIVGTGSYCPEIAPEDPATGQSERITPFWMSGGTGIELTVDLETGKIAIDRLINVADGGVVLNPDLARRQITGAAIMQLGNTMAEELRFEDGRLINGTLRDYKIPALLDLPAEIETDLVEVAQPDGPYGAKGLGETGTFGVSAAAANAVFDATGVRITELPLNPENVLRALRAHQGRPLEDR